MEQASNPVLTMGFNGPHSFDVLDIIIVGAGLSGLAASIQCALAGHRVTVLESAKGLAEVRNFLSSSLLPCAIDLPVSKVSFSLALSLSLSLTSLLPVSIAHATLKLTRPDRRRPPTNTQRNPPPPIMGRLRPPQRLRTTHLHSTQLQRRNPSPRRRLRQEHTQEIWCSLLGRPSRGSATAACEKGYGAGCGSEM